jgi:hypothetical protein
MKQRNLPRVAGSLLCLVTVAGLLGCASPRGELTLDPVGPPRLTRSIERGRGYLQVKTQREYLASGDIQFFTHTPYLIYDLTGHKVKTVQNHAGPTDQRPMVVDLPSGHYRVLGRASGYGLVTVPVVVSAETLTEVVLSGEGLAEARGANETNVVRLPGGPIVGWRSPVPVPTPAAGK